MSFDGRKRGTGWVPLVINSGNQGVAGATPAYCNVDGLWSLSGKVEKTSGSWTAGSVVTVVSSSPLPAAARPAFRRDFQAAGHAAAADAKLLINTDGSIDLVIGSAVPAYVCLDCALWIP